MHEKPVYRARLFKSRLTLTYDYKLIEVLNSLSRKWFESLIFKLKVKECLKSKLRAKNLLEESLSISK